MRTVVLENKTSTITGWGSVNDEPGKKKISRGCSVDENSRTDKITCGRCSGASSNTKLMQADVPVTSREECRRAYASHKSAVIDDSVLCAGLPDGQKDTCRVKTTGRF